MEAFTIIAGAEKEVDVKSVESYNLRSTYRTREVKKPGHGVSTRRDIASPGAKIC